MNINEVLPDSSAELDALLQSGGKTRFVNVYSGVVFRAIRKSASSYEIRKWIGHNFKYRHVGAYTSLDKMYEALIAFITTP
jgi:hypothetical protein